MAARLLGARAAGKEGDTTLKARPTARRSFRLPPDVRPKTYDLHLVPDLGAGTFQGELTLATEIGKARSRLVLHAAELRISTATVRSGGRELTARIRHSVPDETVILELPRRLAAGAVEIRFRFEGRIGTRLRGLYGAEADGRRYAFTQLEAADARRVFPCFDEPAFKARFTIRVTAHPSDHVISNMPAVREEPIGDGRRTVHFAPTPLLSTYLLALAVGPLVGSRVRRLGRIPIRVWHVPGREGLTGFALEAASESLRRLERYFGIRYPYPKLDLVAVPDFEAGAMENAGAVFFRETLLLIDPRTASLAERKRAAEVIAHELAHMWYGDLVTMAWWDDLWLNEAFATWMAYRVISDWRPQWRMWESFAHDRAAALGLDALASTHPIYAPVRNVAEATENFDVITYEKGAAVVRMLENFLGPSVFRDGVRRYIRRHREGNTVAKDLWKALEEASRRDVASVAEAWISQAGFPLVSMRRTHDVLSLRQERFFSDPRVPASRRRGRWPVPLVLRSGRKTEAVLLRRVTATTPRRGRWTFGNANAGGFYRVRHDAADLEELLPAIDRLSAVERLALVGDQWALVRAGKEDVERFLDLVAALVDERDPDVLDGILVALDMVNQRILEDGGGLQQVFRTWIAERFGPAFRSLGWKPRRGETDLVRLRRVALLRVVGGVAEEPRVLREARRRLGAYLRDRRTLDPNLADPVVALGAREGDDALYERFRRLSRDVGTPQERRRFLLGLASFRSPTMVRRTLAATLTDAIPTQDVILVLMRLFANPVGRESTWRFLRRRWPSLRKRLPPLMLARLVESTPLLRDRRYAREVRDFFRAHPIPEARRSLRQALEIFRLDEELRRRTRPGIERWLDEHR